MFGSGPPTAEGRDGRQRGLAGGRHLGCSRPQSLSRAAAEGGPTGHAVLIRVSGLPGELILPSGLVTARYVTGRRERPDIRPAALRVRFSRLRRVSASDRRCLGRSGWGKSVSARGGGHGGCKENRKSRSRPLTCDSSAGDARKSAHHPLRGGDAATKQRGLEARSRARGIDQLQKSTGGTWPARPGEQPVGVADLAYKGCARTRVGSWTEVAKPRYRWRLRRFALSASDRAGRTRTRRWKTFRAWEAAAWVCCLWKGSLVPVALVGRKARREDPARQGASAITVCGSRKGRQRPARVMPGPDRHTGSPLVGKQTR